MTHDELLAKINALEETIHRELSNTLILGSATPFQALRAVVELHKPFQFEDAPELYKPVCQHCQLGAVGDVYPCETIYAIEKALS